MRISLAFTFLTCVHLAAYAQGGQGKPIEVETGFAKEDTFIFEIDAVGTIKGNEQVTLSTSITEVISNIPVEEGSRVKQGEVIVEMTNREQRALLDEARGNLKEAKLQLDRATSLLSSGAGTQSVVDTRKRDYQSALAQLGSVESRIKDRLLTAPFDGVVGIRMVSPGALVRPGDQILTLVDDSEIKVDFTVPERFFGELKVGSPLNITSSAGNSAKGEISVIDSFIQEDTRSFQVRGLITEKKELFASGMFVNVYISLPPRNLFSLPEEALQQLGTRAFVKFVGKDEKVEEKDVTVIGRRDGKVFLSESPNVPVIIRGAFKVRVGQTVLKRELDKL